MRHRNYVQLPALAVTVRRNNGSAKFYRQCQTLEEAEAVAAEQNALELTRRKVRAAERGQTIEQCDQYTYEVVQR